MVCAPLLAFSSIEDAKEDEFPHEYENVRFLFVLPKLHCPDEHIFVFENLSSQSI